MITKVCYECGKELDLDLFHHNRSKPDGRASVCKECKSELDKKYQENNKAKIKVGKHKSYLKHRDKVIARVCLYSKNNRERCRAWSTKSKNKLKAEVFSHYCNGDIVCQWCKKEREIDLLTIDHVAGGGNEQRKSVGIKTGL